VTAPRALAQTPPPADALTEIDRLADALDWDVEKIFRFVADEVRYEPYPGILRGAQGTLAALAGNAADQALLLAALLESSQVAYRFAQGRLDESTVEALMSGAGGDGATIRAEVSRTLAGEEATDPALEPRAGPDTGRQIEEARAAGQRVVDWARGQLRQTVGTIERALQNGGITLDRGFTQMPERERREHLWVQVANGPEWIDLDPTLPGGAAGTVLASDGSGLVELPAELRHRVRVAVIVERVAGGTLVEQAAIEIEQAGDELATIPLLVVNMRAEGMKGIGVQIGDLLEGTTSYVPFLSMGENAHYGDLIRFGTGDDVLGTGPGGAIGDGEATAQWLEVTVTSPDAEPVTVRREVFDRIGPAARAAGPVDISTLEPVESVELTPGGSAEYLPALTAHWVSVATGTIGGSRLRRSLQVTDEPEGLAGAVRAYHVVREAAGLEVALPAGVHAVANAPNVVAMTARALLDPDGGPVVEAGVDILHRSYALLPVRDTATDGSPSVIAGATSHIAERVMGGDGDREAGPGSEPAPVSVGAVFDQAIADGVPLTLVRDVVAARALPYPPDPLARLTSALDAGWIAVAPERPVQLAGRERVGWWLIDPLTGRTIDQLDDGRGGMLEHEHILIQTIIKTHPAWLILGVCVAGIGLFVANFIGLMVASGGDSGVAMGLFGGGALAGGLPGAIYCAAAV
jgi:hypothetical protein